MAGPGANTNPRIDECMRTLKAKIPVADHSALESRLHALINDPDADDNDIISILQQEFNAPSHCGNSKHTSSAAGSA
jgi:hypothetical protein